MAIIEKALKEQGRTPGRSIGERPSRKTGARMQVVWQEYPDNKEDAQREGVTPYRPPREQTHIDLRKKTREKKVRKTREERKKEKKQEEGK